MSIFTTSKDVTISFEEYDSLHHRINSLRRDNEEYIKVINQQQNLIESLQDEKQHLNTQIEQFEKIELQYAKKIR